MLNLAMFQRIFEAVTFLHECLNKSTTYKKALQSNVNRPLADSTDYIVNKLENVGWEGGYL